MESQTINAAEFRGKQKEQWGTAASGWRKWNDLIVEASRSVTERLVELAGVRAGSRVLDIAAGTGEPSLTAARAAGSEGHVVATDISGAMLEVARDRAADLGLDNLEFVESDAGSLDYPAETFDAALSRWGIIFEPDAEAVAERVRGFLKPGARMAISSWGPPDRVPFIALPMMTAMRKLDVPPPPPGTPGPLSRPTRQALGGLLEAAGFGDVEVEETEVDWEFDSPEQFTEYTKDIVAPIKAMLAQHPQDVQDETWNAITEAAREHADADGHVSFTNLVLLAAGHA